MNKLIDNTEYSEMDMFLGNAFQLVANRYETLKEGLLEAVQNSLDKKARSINIVLNRKTRYAAVRDDGNGVSIAEFDQKLLSICHSDKIRGKGNLGRFGIGFIAPLGKCDIFTFTSCPKGESDYIKWTFVSADIIKSGRRPRIPRVHLPELAFRPQGAGMLKEKTAAWWRSELIIQNFKEDKLISRFDSAQALADEIKREYRLKMLENGTMLTVKFTNLDGTEEKVERITAERFNGSPLKRYVTRNRDVGIVEFELYLANKTKDGYGGNVDVGEIGDGFCFSFGTFAKSVASELPREISDALNSGIFEGVVRGEKIQLDPSRKSFLRNAALEGFCTGFKDWFESTGKRYVEQVTESRKEERWQGIMEKSLANIQELLEKNPAFAHLRGAFDNLNRGTGSKKRGTALGDESEPSLSVGGDAEINSISKPHDPSNVDPPSPSPDPVERKKKLGSFSVGGPDGQRRRTTKHGGAGLQLSVEAIEELLRSNRLYLLKVEDATLYFNTRHPTWEACDVSPTRLQQMQETATIFALTANSMPEGLQAAAHKAFEEAITPLVVGVFHKSDAFVLSRRRNDR